MKRRFFLGRTGRLAAAFSALGLSIFRPAPAASLTVEHGTAEQGTDARERLLDALPNRAHAVAIGKARLADLETPPDTRTLSMRLAACIERSPADLSHCRARDLRSDLKTRIAADFAGNRTVCVRGWVLASSEADLFCLAALAET